MVEAGELSGGFNPSGQIRLSSAIIIIIIIVIVIIINIILVVIVIVIVIMSFLRLNKTNMC